MDLSMVAVLYLVWFGLVWDFIIDSHLGKTSESQSKKAFSANLNTATKKILKIWLIASLVPPPSETGQHFRVPC